MLSFLLAHAGPPPTPEELWSAWNLDPLVSLPFLAVGWTYWRGWTALHRRRPAGWRPWWFTLGLLAVGIALLSPLDALSSALASAHMTQHMLLMVVAAPLIAASRPLNSILRGVPNLAGLERSVWPRAVWQASAIRIFRLPLVAWILHATTLWIWHARVPYEAALRIETVHILEHTGFFLTALLFWSSLSRVRRSQEMGWGLGVLLVFAMSVQSTILAALMTFAPTPWYQAYAETTRVWGIEHLADQQLAAVIMWIPSGMIYLGAALALMSSWMREDAGSR